MDSVDVDIMDDTAVVMDVGNDGSVGTHSPPPAPWSYSASRTGDSRLDELERATDDDLKRTPHELLVRWVAESLPDEGSGSGDRPPDFAALSRGLARETTRMISWKEDSTSKAERERRGLSLGFGEYYLSDPDELSSSDDEVEEAEEVSEEHLLLELLEEKKAMEEEDLRITLTHFHEPAETTAPSPSLLGMPDGILHLIFLQLTGFRQGYFCPLIPLEGVCKRFLGLVRTDDLNLIARTNAPRVNLLRSIRLYQKRTENIILEVLVNYAGDGGVAGVLRDVVAGVVSLMHFSGNEVHFRLRGDSLGYLTEFVQDYMVRMLGDSLLFSCHGGRKVLNAEDIIRRFNIFPHSILLKEFTSSDPLILEPKSGTIWRWPEGSLCGVLPSEAGRRIVRGLAFRAGVCEMNDDALLLAEEAMLRLMGMIVVDALEASIENSLTHFLKESEEYVYDSVVDDEFTVDAYCIPPPPIYADDEEKPLYTVVPGLLRNAVRSRNIGHLYGHPWVECECDTQKDDWFRSDACALPEDEWELEASYYYESLEREETWTSGEDNDDENDYDDSSMEDKENDGEAGEERK